MKYNEMAFTPEEVDKGMHLKLLSYLLSYSTDSESSYNDIHITTDGYCTIIQWVVVSLDNMDAPRFKFVDYDEFIMRELDLPDKSIEYVFPDEYDSRLKEWCEEHPNYKKNYYGIWVNTDGGDIYEKN